MWLGLRNVEKKKVCPFLLLEKSIPLSPPQEPQTPLSSLRTPASYQTCLEIDSLYRHHWALLLSLNIVILRFIHVAAYINNLFLFIAELWFIIWMTTFCFSVHPWVGVLVSKDYKLGGLKEQNFILS